MTRMGISVGHWIGNAVRTAGKPLSAAGHVLQGAEGAVAKEIAKIPIIGKPLHGLFDGPFMLAFGPLLAVSDAIQGERIDKALLGRLKDEIQDVKEVAPYAQTVISIIPGIGPPVSGAISAGLALAEGQSISDVMIAAVKGAIPGGALAAAVFDVSRSAIHMAVAHVPLTWASVLATSGAAASDLAGLSDAAKAAIVTGLSVAGSVVTGSGVKSQVVTADQTLAQMTAPSGVVQALGVGVALGHAESLQSMQSGQLASEGLRNRLMAIGQSVGATDAIVSAARATLTGGFVGFDTGVGLMRQEVGAGQVQGVRAALPTDADRIGFDLAMSLHIGRVANTYPSDIQNAKTQAGYMATLGLQGAPLASKTAVLASMQEKPAVKVGAAAGITTVATRRASWFSRLWHWVLSIEHKL
jgi:hypothetical protein